MEITAIVPQKKDKTRCNIEVDGRFYCGMKLETVIKNRLKAGDSVSEEELSRLQLESEKQTAFDKALTHISASMKTEREIRDYLKKKGYLEETSNYVVDKMKGYGFLDDAAYAKAYAESVKTRKGAKLIAMELRQKGIAEESVTSAIEALTDEGESAFRLLEKYMRGKTADQATLQKAYRHLLSKGFSYDTARDALASFKDNDED